MGNWALQGRCFGVGPGEMAWSDFFFYTQTFVRVGRRQPPRWNKPISAGEKRASHLPVSTGTDLNEMA